MRSRPGAGPAADPATWLLTGADALSAALREAPDDLEVFTFLRDAPPARLFWARRQHHETAVHALDTLAARDGRTPTAGDVWFDAAAALDSVDELVTGFWPRRTKGLRPSEDPYRAMVQASTGERWVVEVDADSVRTRRLAPDEPDPGPPCAVLSGDPVDLQLALWNRGGAPSDPDGLLARWRSAGAVRW